MKDLTLEQISIAIIFLVGLIGGVVALGKYIVNALKLAFKDDFKGINDKIDELTLSIKKTDKNATMNYLVRCIDDIDRGIKLESASKQRFYEQCEHYIKDLEGNTYIKKEIDKLEKEGKL